jgi:hypothetical protein
MVEPVPVRYEELSSAAYNEGAAKTSRVTLIPDERKPEAIVIEGPCPRCSHPTLFTEPLVAYLDVGSDPFIDQAFDEALKKVAGEFRERHVVVLCNCNGWHSDQPSSKRGCGASWTLTVAWNGT